MTPHAENLSSRFAWQKRLYALAALLLVMSAHACPPEVDKAVVQLQESARAEISAEDWLAQIVDKTGEFFDWSALQSDGKAAPRKNLRTTLFPDKRTLVYLRKYLAEVKIRQGNREEGLEESLRAFRKFLFHGITYEFGYEYPSARYNIRGSECQLFIHLNRSFFVDEDFGNAESSYMYHFDLVNGKMKLIKTNAAG